MEPPAAREVRVEVVPADGYQLEIEGALSDPYVTTDDMNRYYEEVIADSVRRELFIADDVPLVLLVTDEDGELRRIEQSKKPVE
ncbi:hypothetical protein [Kitasatospora sp. NBC_01300]|uniref:hypothetical protein n=1 Tax=Kitasatospora sp. NBC_01300 TaxID=2903574 RepID=UPI00352E2207|nr:hypothetical protein OG556_18275 [Kitasatospora sp. NBC_01300]